MQREQRSIAIGPGRRVRITVRGRLSERLAAAFDGMSLASGPGQTELVGDVVDQAHLYGLLTRVRDLGLELESVNPVSDETLPDGSPATRAAAGRSARRT